MFRKIFYIFLILFINVTILRANEIVFINVDLLINNSNEGKIIIAKLNDLNKKNQLEYEKRQNEIKIIKTEIDNLKNILNQEELDKKIVNLNNAIKDFNEYSSKSKNEFEKIKNNELKIFFDKITPLLEKFMLDNSVKIILDKKNIFIADDQYDITPDIINIINKMN